MSDHRSCAVHDLCCAGYAASPFNCESEGRTFESFRARQAKSNCAYRKSSPSILVTQSTQDRTGQNAPRCLGGT